MLKNLLLKDLLNSLILSYKPPLQNRFFPIKWSFGRENALILAFWQMLDNEDVAKWGIPLFESKGYFGCK